MAPRLQAIIQLALKMGMDSMPHKPWPCSRLFTGSWSRMGLGLHTVTEHTCCATECSNKPWRILTCAQSMVQIKSLHELMIMLVAKRIAMHIN